MQNKYRQYKSILVLGQCDACAGLGYWGLSTKLPCAFCFNGIKNVYPYSINNIDTIIKKLLEI